MNRTRIILSQLTFAILASCPGAWATLGDYQQAVTNEATLISYYTFDKSNAVDIFGPNNGTLQGTAAFADGIGTGGRSVALDGGGRVTLGVVPEFAFASGTGSVEAWIRPGWAGTFSAYNPCVFANRDGGPVTWSVHMNGDKSGIGVWNGSSYLPIPIPSPGTNWHHLVVTFDNSSLSLVTIYWDGVSVGDRNQDLGTGSNPTQLGSSAAAVTDEGWIGNLDEVAFYSTALAPAAVLAHYQALFVGTPPVIAKQPAGGTFLPGVNLQVSVAATGPNLSYQWFKGTNAVSGATSSVLSFPSLAQADAGTYHVVVSNPAANVSSSNVVIAVSNVLSSSLVAYQTSVTNTSGLGSYYPFDQLTANDALGQHQGTLQGTAYFTAGVAGGPDQALLLDGAGFAGLGAVPDFDFATGVGSVEAWVRADWTDIGYNPCLVADRNESAVNWSIHMNADKKAIGVRNGTAYTILAIPDAGTAWHHMAVVFDTGNFTLYWDGMLVGIVPQPLGGAAATIQFGSSLVNATAEGWVGALDEIALYSVALSAGSVQAHYAALIGASAPVITVQPLGGAFYPGVPFQLQVGATGAGLGYQWYKNGSAIGGETNWFLTFAGLTVQDAGSYYAQVSNTGGSVKSATVSVQVGNNLAGYHAAVAQEPSLISYYTFDQSDAVDSKGTNNGTLVGSPTFTAGVGQGTDQAILLDGTGDIDLGAVPAFEFTNGVGTVEAWIRPDWTTDPGYDPCIVADRNGGPTDWSIHMVRTRAAIGNWNGSHFQSSGVANTTGWHHYAVVFGAGQVSMYWDGDLLGSFAQAINLGSGLTAQIGSSASGSTVEGWIGALDEVAFYSASLSGTAIHNHFLSMIGAASAPKLLFSQANNQLTLSWPDGGAFTLEYADTLPAVSWTAVPGLTTNQAVLPLTNSHRFFRLRQ